MCLVPELTSLPLAGQARGVRRAELMRNIPLEDEGAEDHIDPAALVRERREERIEKFGLPTVPGAGSGQPHGSAALRHGAIGAQRRFDGCLRIAELPRPL